MEAAALRIRMEGGLEAIESASGESLALARQLRRASWPLGFLFVDRFALADRVRAFAREQARVDEATQRLAKLGATEGWPDGREPRCAEELRRARLKLGAAAARACLALGGSPSGALVEDLTRAESQLRQGPQTVDAPLVVEPADPSAPYAAQWRDFRARRRTGVLLNLLGPLWLWGLTTSVSPLAAPAFIAWVVGNWVWSGWMGRFACPRCKEPFAERHPLTPERCDHCGLRRYEGDDPWRHRRLKA